MAINKSEFLKRFNDKLGNHKRITNETSGWPFPQYEKLAELTAKINYGCDFDESGRCVNYKGRDSNMCCCSGCVYSIGFLSTIHRSHIAVLAKHFDSKTGFWRNKRGCILPRKYRSPICVSYHCVPLDNPRDHLLRRSITYGPTRVKGFIFRTEEIVSDAKVRRVSRLICDFLCRIYNEDNTLIHKRKLCKLGVTYLKGIRTHFRPEQQQYVRNLITFYGKE